MIRVKNLNVCFVTTAVFAPGIAKKSTRACNYSMEIVGTVNAGLIVWVQICWDWMEHWINEQPGSQQAASVVSQWHTYKLQITSRRSCKVPCFTGRPRTTCRSLTSLLMPCSTVSFPPSLIINNLLWLIIPLWQKNHNLPFHVDTPMISASAFGGEPQRKSSSDSNSSIRELTSTQNRRSIPDSNVDVHFQSAPLSMVGTNVSQGATSDRLLLPIRDTKTHLTRSRV